MRILVTGGAGYIGSHTVIELLEMGYDVITLDNLQKGHREAISGGEFVKVDLLNKNELEDVFKNSKIDAVVHFAADSLVGESVENPSKYFKSNMIASLNLLDAMLKYDVKKIVFSSSAAVYGEPDRIPIQENNKTFPTNPYGETKLMFENAIKWYDNAYGIKYVSLRYFNAAGAHISGKIGEDHAPESHLIPIVLQAVLGQRPHVQIFGTDYETKDGTCVRDYIHITDLAMAHILALKRLEKGGDSAIYNLGNGEGFSVREIIKVAEKVTGKKINTKDTPRRAGDPAVLIATSEKIKKELNWAPKYNDINTIVETAWKWHKSNPKGFKTS
ncbi:MAG: UDP-glucose 4-epimerase GalE [Elusimicrobia bacterium RIFOXYC2_FULL_34_12]|nr:MAG: UDP-glucose 4-epimerase GalE [Elusimicrobia bacterium RIFOXYC2_FULL_34_12]OGS39625.1 MAG: UDP-glucose 4-epimerase GalE [Elusimicrobia bacterium RIFOXYD2_FULL_34_30]HAM39388.1 UDP-glucose 4-epimerase GalE [Elusimicrobiota bacterium]